MFALSLPFNLSRRMERLFNSSITRKCPPEHKRRGAKAGEAGCLEPPFPPPHIYQPVKSAGEQRRLDVLHGKTASAVNALNIPAGISRVAGFIVTFVFATVTLIRTSAEPPPRVAQRVLSALRPHRLHMHLFPGRFRIALFTSARRHLHNFQSGCRWPHLKRHTSGRVEALGCRHVCLFRLSF